MPDATPVPPAQCLGPRDYFAGLALPQAAEVLGVSPGTAGRRGAFARAWLRREIDGDGEAGENS